MKKKSVRIADVSIEIYSTTIRSEWITYDLTSFYGLEARGIGDEKFPTAITFRPNVGLTNSPKHNRDSFRGM
jgi:hypothetical protein